MVVPWYQIRSSSVIQSTFAIVWRVKYLLHKQHEKHCKISGTSVCVSWNRCSGDPTSVKCKVSVDSYKTCSVFKGRKYSLVRIWCRPNCKSTNDRRPSKETLCISGLFYFLGPWLRCLLLVRSNRFKTFTDWHPGLVRFPMLSIWSWSSSSQMSNPMFLSFPTKGGTWVNRLFCGMIYLLENFELSWRGRNDRAD